MTFRVLLQLFQAGKADRRKRQLLPLIHKVGESGSIALIHIIDCHNPFHTTHYSSLLHLAQVHLQIFGFFVIGSKKTAKDNQI